MSHRTTARRAGLLALGALAALAPTAGAVTGGTPTPPGQGTFAAALVSAEATRTVAAGQFCGATFVRDDALLTAAHCVVEDADATPEPADLRVFAGRSLPLGAGPLRRVAQVTVHPGYDDGRGESNADVAVLRLARPVTGRLAAALPAPGDAGGWVPGAPLTVLGWGNRAFVDGTTAEDVNFPRQLQQGGVTRATDARCDDLYGRFYNPSTQLCAGLPQGGVDACNGDSGGPLVAGRPDGRAVLVGIVSYGEGCGRAQFPTVYTKVARYEAWISEQLARPVRPTPPRHPPRDGIRPLA